MERYNADVTSNTLNGIIVTVSKNIVITPAVRWNGKGVKWYDDNQLIRKESK